MSSYDEHLITQAGGDGDDLDAIQRRADKATPGPWGTLVDTYRSVPMHRIGSDISGVDVAQVIYHGAQESSDARFIANARTDVPALLALVRAQQATLAAVLNLANTSGRCGWRISADELRKTLRGES